jgi:hypothetical protein
MYSNFICVLMLWPKIKLYKMRGVMYTFNKNIIHCPKQCEAFVACLEGDVCVCIHTYHSVYRLFPNQIPLLVSVKK